MNNDFRQDKDKPNPDEFQTPGTNQEPAKPLIQPTAERAETKKARPAMRILTLLVVSALMIPTFSYAEHEFEGRLKKVYSDFITVTYVADTAKSNDMNRFATGEIAVGIDSQTHYANFATLSDLREGDLVGIDLRNNANTKNKDKVTAQNITKISSLPEQADDMNQVVTTTTTTVTSNSAIIPAY